MDLLVELVECMYHATAETKAQGSTEQKIVAVNIYGWDHETIGKPR